MWKAPSCGAPGDRSSLSAGPPKEEFAIWFRANEYPETPPLPMSTQTAQDRYLPVNGARLRWRLEGAGPALVLLHGWALDLAYWEPVIAPLARDFTVLRFDRRGF